MRADPLDLCQRMAELLDRATGHAAPVPYVAWLLGAST